MTLFPGCDGGPIGPAARPVQHRFRGGFQQLLAGLPLHRTGANFAHLQRNRPFTSARIFPQGMHLHWQGLLIIGGDAGIQTSTEHFRRFSCVAKNVFGFSFMQGPFYGHFSMSDPPGRRGSFWAIVGHHITRQLAC